MKVAVLGFGTVGYGVYEMLEKAKGLEPGNVLVRPSKVDATFKVGTIEEIINDPSVDAVAEVMGGIEPAFSYVAAALKAGKHVVTSNKALVAAKGPELETLAKENDVAFLFSAACGGAVPFLHNLALAAESDEIISIGGILNGTTNYMLDAMQRRSLSYEEALSDAQRLGYAEADPTADVSGLDALRKIMLACAVAYDILPTDGLYNEGIDSLTAEDVDYLKSIGLTCRLLASGGKNADGSVYSYVEPVLLEAHAPECSVLNNFNMAKYVGKNSGLIVFMGQGAGRYPTASAIIRDLSDIVHGKRDMMNSFCVVGKADNSYCRHSYLVRVPADCSISIEYSDCCTVNGCRYIQTAEISVADMHNYVNSLRKDGSKIFFAALG